LDQLSNGTRLAIALAACLALADPCRLTTEELAAETGTSSATAIRTLRRLAETKLVRGTRGPNGGWRLCRPPSSISVLDVIRASHRLPESARGTTAITELVREAMAAASTQLARTSLKDLVERLEASQGTLVPAGERESEYSDN
jgi:Rrf2 family protein